MAWLKKGGSKISKAEAMKMIDEFHKDKKDHTRSIYYDKTMVQSLLDTPRAAGVKIFFAKNKDIDTVVLFPVDENGIIIEDSEYAALEVGNPCPPYC